MSGCVNSAGETVCPECGCEVPTETLKERRDRFAAAALTGLRAAGEPIVPSEIAEMAVMDADALIAALDKPREPQT